MKELERSFCTVYFDNFFNSLKLIEKTIPKRHLQYWNSSSQQKQMPKMIDDKQMNRRDCKLLFSVNTVTCKWIDNLSVPLLSYALEGMNYYQFRGEKSVQAPSFWFVVLRLSGFTVRHGWVWSYEPMYCRISSGLKVIC